MNDQNRREIMTLADASAYLRCHASTIYRQAKDGRIPGFRLGARGPWRFVRSELEAWIRKQTREAFR